MPTPTVPTAADPPSQTRRDEVACYALVGILAVLTPSDAFEAADPYKEAPDVCAFTQAARPVRHDGRR